MDNIIMIEIYILEEYNPALVYWRISVIVWLYNYFTEENDFVIVLLREMI